MTQLLAIETSAARCSVALQVNDQITERSLSGQRSHTASLLPFVQELLADAGIAVKDLDAIVFSAGPGSFTGIRLAASVAKSLAYAADIPVVAVSSLAVLAQGGYRCHQLSSCGVVSDARMDELYLGHYALETSPAGPVMVAKSADDLVKIAGADIPDLDSWVTNDAAALSAIDVVAHLSLEEVISSAVDALALGHYALLNGDTSTALDAEAIYLRGKSGWKTTAEQGRPAK
ncbi:tRNA threonylcarbamoyladenosine biosynthesis protein TsaB [BD1-7 clade bacterium]|uniref:tRNA threonylcarbamoyladenosine biosynthesis protein TsaB n=1 Tax=BD1-7 clade bacterium TaxID=2029982 RepID=A0A5S9N2H9_9GAMM|nr:tRNA threonylcarbamoyladenosine biosynthesis protein TsaB [BD1-7 clade bacterium]